VLIYLNLSNVQRSGPVQRTRHDSTRRLVAGILGRLMASEKRRNGILAKHIRTRTWYLCSTVGAAHAATQKGVCNSHCQRQAQQPGNGSKKKKAQPGPVMPDIRSVKPGLASDSAEDFYLVQDLVTYSPSREGKSCGLYGHRD